MLTFEDIIAYKKTEVEKLKITMRQQGSTTVIRSLGEVRSFKRTLQNNAFLIIPEIKKADPWCGNYCDEFSAKELARNFEFADAKTLAVHSDSKYFQGSLEDVYFASKNSGLPILARDFVIDEVQLTEAKSMGADAIILMPKIIEADRIQGFINFAQYIMLEIAVEVSNQKELEIALESGADLIGIQNRDWETHAVSFDFAQKCASMIPNNITKYCIGGVKNIEDAKKFKELGYHGVIVGETLIKAEMPGDKYRNFIKIL